MSCLPRCCRAGASAAIVRPEPPAPVRTLMLTDLRWALATRRAVTAELARTSARALIYSTTTAALLWPRPGAIRFDAPAAANRPGRHGLWQRPLERRRLREASLLLAQSEGALLEVPAAVRGARRREGALVLPVPVEPSGTHESHSLREIGKLGDSEYSGEATRRVDHAFSTMHANCMHHTTNAISPRSHMRQTQARRASTSCSMLGEESAGRGGAARGGRGKSASYVALAMRLPAAGVRVVGMLAPRGLPRTAAPRARIRVRGPPRGLWHRPARGAGGRLHARDDTFARPVRGATTRS